jgi:hypothetical protein
MKLERESPQRLRACLNALACAAGLDVYRCEQRISEDGNVQIIVTASREHSEEAIAALIVSKLRAYWSAAERREASEGDSK